MLPPALDYEFFSPPRIVFGWGRRREIGSLTATLGCRAFVITGSRTLEKNGTFVELFDLLKKGGISAHRVASISHEPEVGDVDSLTGKLTEFRPTQEDLVIGVGGGSAIDLAKAAAAMATNRESPNIADYLEGVGRGLQIKHPPLPMLAMPTTAGTGSEATKNSVISSYCPPFKKSLRSDLMVPRIVLVDPELSVHVPPDVTAHTGMDTITQLIESYISRRAKPIPQALGIHGLKLAIPALPEAVRDGNFRWAREAMAHAALLSGMALANSGLGLAHGVAAALGAECRVRHGLACAVMLPAALNANRGVSEVQLATLGRGICSGSFANDAAAADAFIECIHNLGQKIGVPNRLRDLGVRREQIPALVAGSKGNSLAGNPREITPDELEHLLDTMF